jgi:hypothetical protein
MRPCKYFPHVSKMPNVIQGYLKFKSMSSRSKSIFLFGVPKDIFYGSKQTLWSSIQTYTFLRHFERLTFEGSTYKNVIKRKHHTVGTVPNCKRKMVERDKIDPSNTQIHVYSFAWLGAGISIKNDGVKRDLQYKPIRFWDILNSLLLRFPLFSYYLWYKGSAIWLTLSLFFLSGDVQWYELSRNSWT